MEADSRLSSLLLFYLPTYLVVVGQFMYKFSESRKSFILKNFTNGSFRIQLSTVSEVIETRPESSAIWKKGIEKERRDRF